MSVQPKIAIIGTVGLPACYGGFETLANYLTEELGERYAISVYCAAKKYKKENRRRYYKNARLYYLPFNANGIQSIVYDSLSVLHALLYADVLLMLGVSGAWLLPFVRLFTRRKIIISIDGIEWKRNKWNRVARWYLWWAEKMAVKYGHTHIADNESIQDYTALRYGKLSSIIEYGADHTMAVKATAADKQLYPFLAKPYAFKVCRIEPENNIDMVLEAFATMPHYTLVMAGNWNNSAYGQRLRKQYAACSNLILLDPVYEQRRIDMLRSNALVYIHGHSAGGTNPSLAEAMYLQLPVIAFDVSYNRTTTEQQALYFKSAADICHIIQHTTLHELKKMGEVMKGIANRRYTWLTIARKYAFIIDAALQQQPKAQLLPRVAQVPAQYLQQLELAHLHTPSLFFEKR
jgi:glycosyltransferase involved in cell wall biosynthesis